MSDQNNQKHPSGGPAPTQQEEKKHDVPLKYIL